jgi:hypothetical protein
VDIDTAEKVDPDVKLKPPHPDPEEKRHNKDAGEGELIADFFEWARMGQQSFSCQEPIESPHVG